jgi:hypothetical protein
MPVTKTATEPGREFSFVWGERLHAFEATGAAYLAASICREVPAAEAKRRYAPRGIIMCVAFVVATCSAHDSRAF